MKHILSVKKEQSFLKWALIQKNGKDPIVRCLDYLDLSSCDSPYEEIFKRIGRILQKEAPLLVGSLPASKIVQKKITIPVTAKKAIASALKYQIETLFPYSLEGFHLEKRFFTEKKQTDVQLCLTHASLVKSAIDELKQIDLEPEGLTNDIEGLKQFFIRQQVTEKTILAHLGYQETLLLLFENQKLLKEITFSSGYKELAGRDQIDLERTIASSYQSHYAMQMQRALVSLCGSEKIPCLLTGFFQLILNREDCFPQGMKELKIESETLFDAFSTGFFALEIGLGLVFLEKNTLQYDLKPYSTEKKEIKEFNFLKKSAFLSFFLVALTLFIYCFVKNDLRSHLTEVLESRGMHFSVASTLDEVFSSIKNLNDLEKNKPLFLDCESKPFLITKLIDHLAGPIKYHKLEMKKINYAVLQYPTFKSPSKTYQIKVILGVCGELIDREEFIKTLKKQSWVDQKKSVKCEKNETQTTMEFFLNSTTDRSSSKKN
jgi:hypothetical protein